MGIKIIDIVIIVYACAEITRSKLDAWSGKNLC